MEELDHIKIEEMEVIAYNGTRGLGVNVGTPVPEDVMLGITPRRSEDIYGKSLGPEDFDNSSNFLSKISTSGLVKLVFGSVIVVGLSGVALSLYDKFNEEKYSISNSKVENPTYDTETGRYELSK